MAWISMLLVFAVVAVLSLAMARLGLALMLSVAGQPDRSSPPTL